MKEKNQKPVKPIKLHIFSWRRFWIKFLVLALASFLSLYAIASLVGGIVFERVTENYSQPKRKYGLAFGNISGAVDQDGITTYDTSLWKKEGIYLDGQKNIRSFLPVKPGDEAGGNPYISHYYVESYGNKLSTYTIKSNFIDPANNPHKNDWVIFQHGITSDWTYSLLVAQAWLREGYNAVVFDAHAIARTVQDSLGYKGSTGRIATFGYYEQNDLHTLVNWLPNVEPSMKNLGIYAISMGAASLLMYLSKWGNIDYNNNKNLLRFAIADSGYAYLKQELCSVSWGTFRVPPFIIYGATRLWWSLFNGFDVNSINPIHNLNTVKVPTMIVQGTNDTFVPYANNFHQIYNALSSLKENTPTNLGDKEAVRLPGAKHANHVIWNYLIAMHAGISYVDGPFFKPMLNWTALHFNDN